MKILKNIFEILIVGIIFYIPITAILINVLQPLFTTTDIRIIIMVLTGIITIIFLFWHMNKPVRPRELSSTCDGYDNIFDA